MKRLSVAAVLVLYAVVFLYPFSWSPPRSVANPAEKTPAGWRFPAPGLVRSRGPAVFDDGRFDLKLHVRTERTNQRGPARIFTISKDPSLRNLTLGQEGTDLILRVRAPGTTHNGMPQHRVDGVFSDNAWHALRLAISGDTVGLFVDGEPRWQKVYGGPVIATWDRDYKVALGNEPTGLRPWLGEIEYTGVLERPERYWIMHQAPRWKPFRDVQGADALLNFLGFAPLGVFLVRLGWPRRAALLVAAVLSLGIELVQLGLVDRFTSTTDVLLNTLGGLAGALMYRPPGIERGDSARVGPSDRV